MSVHQFLTPGRWMVLVAQSGQATWAGCPPHGPATVLWALGIPQPNSYVGKPLAKAFSALRVVA